MIRRGEQGLGDGFRFAPRKISNCFKDREEELSFFRDLQKREKEQAASLLQPVSEEYEANGNYALYKVESRKAEFLAESGKNDYNWLKTPPATPLFLSLEMEANGLQEELVVHKELPILQPLSRFAGHTEGMKSSNNNNNNRSISPNPKPKLPQRHKTPTGRPSISNSLNDKKNMKNAPVINPRTSQPDKAKPTFAPVVKSNIVPKERKPNFLSSNLSKSIGPESDSTTKLKSRGVSPSVRPIVISDETPPNLRTVSRPASATRGRPRNETSVTQKQDSTAMIRRESCSPSVTRGRKVDSTNINAANTSTKGVESRGQILGSRMLDKFMHARTSGVEERQAKIKLNNSMNDNQRSSSSSDQGKQANVKLNGSLNEGSGFGRLMSKSSLDMAIKHMELPREASTGRKHGVLRGRKS